MPQWLGDAEEHQPDAHAGGEHHRDPRERRELWLGVVGTELDVAVARERQEGREEQEAAAGQHEEPAERRGHPVARLEGHLAGSVGIDDAPEQERQHEHGGDAEHDLVDGHAGPAHRRLVGLGAGRSWGLTVVIASALSREPSEGVAEDATQCVIRDTLCCASHPSAKWNRASARFDSRLRADESRASGDRGAPGGATQPPGGATQRTADQPSQASTLSGFSSIHLAAASSGDIPSDCDVASDDVLVLVGPGEVLDQADRGGVALGPLGADDLLQLRLGVVAGDRLRVVLAAVLVRRQRDSLHRDLGVEVLRLVPVADDPLLVLLGGAERLDGGGLAAGEDDLEVQAEVLHDRLVELDVRRVGAEELALAVGLAGLELGGVLVEVLPLTRGCPGAPRRATAGRTSR